MEEKLESSIDKFLTAYSNSSLKKEEDILDKEIKEDQKLHSLTLKSKELNKLLKDKDKRGEALKEFTSVKREYLNDPKVKRRIELLHQVKNLLKKIELTLKLDPKDPYENY